MAFFKVTKVSSFPLDNAADRLAVFFQLHGNPQDWRYLYEAPQPLDHKPSHDFIQIVMLRYFFELIISNNSFLVLGDIGLLNLDNESTLAYSL